MGPQGLLPQSHQLYDANAEGDLLSFKLQMGDDLVMAHAGLVLAHELHLGFGVDSLVDELMLPPGSGRG